MNKAFLIILSVVFSFISSFGQMVDDIIVTEVKTNYKIYHEGEDLFEAECAQCHGINKQLVSVGLSDVHTKRSRQWLLDFLQKPQTLEYNNDPETQKYRDEYGSISHTVIKHLTQKDFIEILNFTESELNGPSYDYDKVKEVYFVLDKKDIKVGDYKKYFPNGSLSHFYIYNNGLPWEVIEVYDVYGDRKDGGTLQNGTGTINTYDKYGNKESTTTYVRGFRSGEYKQYHDGGQVELLGFYSNGKANGRWTYYYSSGKVKNYMTYRDGRIISNKESDKPGVHSGIGSHKNYGTSSNASNIYTAPANTTVVESTIIYPSNEKIRWEKGEASNPIYTSLGNDLISLLLLKKEDELYINATTGFKRFHPPVVVKQYVRDLESYGKFESYRLDNVGFATVGGRQLILMEYYLTYAYQKIKMYINYIIEGGRYKLDGWSFENTY